MENIPTAEVEQGEGVTDGQCVEAMRQGNFERVREWYMQREKESEQDPTVRGHIELTFRLGRLQMEAGLSDFARETLEAAYMDAVQSGIVDLMLSIAPELDKTYKDTRKG